MSNVIHSHTPNQDIFFKPYTQRFHSFYDHKESKHKYYITPEFGKYTRIVGQDTILEGFEILDYWESDTSVSVEVGKGRAIINDTYVEIHTDNNIITFDQANMFDDAGFFVLSLSFINKDTLRKNQARFHLTYFDQNNSSFGEFNKDKDKIILGVFDFTKDSSNNINSITYRDEYRDAYRNNISTIILDGQSYTVRNDVTNVASTVIDGELAGIELSGLSAGSYLGGNSYDQLLGACHPDGIISVLKLE